jgi:uncharacterized DUF497 family protein
VEFEWDEAKARSNLKKHGISFPYGTLAFLDSQRFERAERAVEYGEERWSITALVEQSEIVVVFTERGDRVRIISARRATPDERADYWKDR